MKNKKYLKVGIAVLLSGILLFAIALSGNAANDGYEQLKALLRSEPVQINNATVHMDVNVSDNGAAVMNVAGDIKADKAAKDMSGQFEINGKAGDQAFEVYKNGDTALFHLAGSQNWYQTTSLKDCSEEQDRFNGHSARGEMKGDVQLRETVMDALMGDLKNQIAVQEANGLRTFSLTLDKGNMPVLIQAAFSAADIHHNTVTQDAFVMAGLPQELQDVCRNMSGYKNLIDLSGSRTLENVKVALTVDQKDQPQAFELSTTISGTAKDGSAHTYAINAKVALSGINSTVPDKTSADPASIKTIDVTQFENARMNRMGR